MRTRAYCRSPHLVLYWQGARLMLCNYATGRRVVAQPIVCDILNFFDRWRTDAELGTARPALDRSALRMLLSILVRRTMLRIRSQSIDRRDRLMSTWTEWNPTAGFFHQSTKDLKYADLATIERLTAEKSRTCPMPPTVKRYRAARVYQLPKRQATGAFADVLLARRTWRRFGAAAIRLDTFADLLALTAGVQAWLPGTHGQRVALKTSPSGGARHALELYALVLRVDGLRRGLYHYVADQHALELITNRVARNPVERYLPTQWWFKGSAAIVFWSAVFAREQWRYDHPRAYRALLIEAGHVCQTFCLTATWLGLAPFCTMALADSRIEHDLKLDGITESVLYAAGIGTRPAAASWRPEEIEAGAPTVTARAAAAFPGRIVARRRRHAR